MAALVRMLVLVCLLLLPSIGLAQLRFEAHETDTGLRFIMVSGTFEPDDDLGDFIRLVEEAPTGGVTFASGGGDLFKAMELGRLIRRYGLPTSQPWVNVCLSACAWAFIGGAERLASAGAIGVHQASFPEDTDMSAYEATAAIQAVTAELMDYVAEMGVDLSIVKLSLRYETDEIRYLTKEELDTFRLNWGIPSGKGEPVRLKQPVR